MWLTALQIGALYRVCRGFNGRIVHVLPPLLNRVLSVCTAQPPPVLNHVRVPYDELVGEALNNWFVATRTFQKMTGKEGGTTGTDDDFAARTFTNVGSCILGHNMFGPVRGPWPDDSWKRWWGDNPPYHAPVFVLTNHSRASVVMARNGAPALKSSASGAHASRCKR